MITIRQKGDFAKLTQYLTKLQKPIRSDILDKYGREGVAALASATPVDSGLTANSWYYEKSIKNGFASLTFYNSNINRGIPIAIIIQYGHGTRNGGWVEGRDYINPAIQPIFDRLAEELWREVTRT